MPDYSAQLNQDKAKDIKTKSIKAKLATKIPSMVVQRMIKAVEDKQIWVWPFAFMLAAYNDLADIGIIGSIPILGDAIDFIVWAILFGFTMSLGGHIRLKIRIIISLAGLFELIPFVDPIPTWVISITWGWFIAQNKGQIAEEGLRKRQEGIIDKRAVAEFK